MWKRGLIEVIGDTPASRARIDGRQALRKRLCRAGSSQSENARAFEQWFNDAPQVRPEFDLPRNRALGNLARQSRIENEVVG